MRPVPARIRNAVTLPAPDQNDQTERASERVTCPAPGSTEPANAVTQLPASSPQPTGGALDPRAELDPSVALLSRRLHDFFTEGDHDQALCAAQQLLALRPNDPEALGYQRSCERLLEQRHAERLGELRRFPELAVSQDQVRWLALDHREGFILSLVDGATSIEEIIDIAGMSRLDVLKTLAGLKEADVIRLR